MSQRALLRNRCDLRLVASAVRKFFETDFVISRPDADSVGVNHDYRAEAGVLDELGMCMLVCGSNRETWNIGMLTYLLGI